VQPERAEHRTDVGQCGHDLIEPQRSRVFHAAGNGPIVAGLKCMHRIAPNRNTLSQSTARKTPPPLNFARVLPLLGLWRLWIFTVRLPIEQASRF
jgi:hypothetical protein